MIRPGFLSPSERRELEACTRSHREDHGIARRANAILLLDDGKSCQAIAEFLYLDDDTIRGWYKTYREAGWDGLSVDGWKGAQARMTSAQEAELCAWLDARFCRSAAPIMAHITAQYGLEYSHSGCLKLLAKIEARNPDKRLIHVIWDNAAYHKGPDVRAFLARPECRIHLIQLPPYCPHLNPIERLWAVMHQFVTHNRHDPTQKQLANAILKFFRETIPNEWEAFRSQVSDNFRIVTHEKFRVLE